MTYLSSTPPAILNPDPFPRLEQRIMAARCHQLGARVARDREAERAAEKLLNVVLEHWWMLHKRRADQAARAAAELL